MKVSINEIENGWLVHYEIFGYADYKTALNLLQGTWSGNKVKKYEKEKAFTYDSDDEFENTWKKVLDFVQECFSIYIINHGCTELNLKRRKG